MPESIHYCILHCLVPFKKPRRIRVSGPLPPNTHPPHHGSLPAIRRPPSLSLIERVCLPACLSATTASVVALFSRQDKAKRREGSLDRSRLGRHGDLRLVQARAARGGLRRERGVRDGRAGRRRRRRGSGRRRHGLPEGGLPLLAEGQERAQPGRRHPLPGIRHGGRRVLRRVRRARAVRAVHQQAGEGLPPLHDPEPPERAPPGGIRGRRRRPGGGLQRRVARGVVAGVVHGRQRSVVAERSGAGARAAAGGVAGGLRQRVPGHGQGAQAPGQRRLQLQRHHSRVRHQAGERPHHRQPRRLQGRAGHHVGDRLPQGRAAHHRPEAQPASGGGADQALQRPRVRAQGRAVGAARVAARRGLPRPGHGAVAGGLPPEAARRGVGARGDAPPRRAGGPVHHPGHGRRVGRAEQRGGGVHRLRHPAEAARVQGRRRGRGAAVADQVPGVPRRRLLRGLPLPKGPRLGQQRRRGQGQGGGRRRETAARPLSCC